MATNDNPRTEMAGWQQQERLRLSTKILTESTVDASGARRWKTNGQYVPLDCFADAGLEAPKAQAAMIKAATDQFLAEYRAAQAGRKYTAEEMFEMRAAFGPGVEVVNVFTGKRTRT